MEPQTMEERLKINTGFIGLVGTAFVLRAALAFLPGLPWDMTTFFAWAAALVSRGPVGFYGSLWCDYLPGYLYVLWGKGLLCRLIESPLSQTPLCMALLKLAPILSDIGLGVILYKWGKAASGSRNTGLFLSALYLLNPAIWIDSAIWGQAESVMAFFFVLSLYFIRNPHFRLTLSAAFLAWSLFTKPLVLIYLPLLALWLLRNYPLKMIARFAGVGALTSLIIVLPFSVNQPWNWLYLQFQDAFHQYPHTSVNAFNLWGLYGLWKPDTAEFLGLTPRLWGLFLFGVSYALVVWRFLKNTGTEALISAFYLIALSSFMFLTRMHDRYLYLAFPFLLLMMVRKKEKVKLFLYGLLSFTFVLNLLYTLYYYAPKALDKPVTPLSSALFGHPWIVPLLSFLNVALWAASMAHGLRFKRRAKKEASALKTDVPSVSLISSQLIKTSVILFLVSFSFYLFRLSVPPEEYFDEVHHVKTARQFVHRQEPTEWTHPHLGKLLMAGSMRIFGERSFAWRLPQTLFGSGMIVLIFLLGATLFKSYGLGLLAAFLLFFDGLQFTISRVGMIDIFAAFFILLSYLIVFRFFLDGKMTNRSWLGLGASLGLAISSKWTAFYAFGGICLLIAWLLIQEARSMIKKPAFPHWVKVTGLRVLLAFVLVPVFIYLFSYFRYVQTGHDLFEVMRYQRTMWNYHANIIATHPYTSPWWSWPLLLRPLWAYYGQIPGTENVRGIIFLGNPAIFWVGIPFLLFALWHAVAFRRKECFLILWAFCFQYFPWILSPRKLVFIHHFYSALPFMILGIVYGLQGLLRRPTGKWAVSIYLVVVTALFFYFYPLLSALPTHQTAFAERMWFKKWI